MGQINFPELENPRDLDQVVAWFEGVMTQPFRPANPGEHYVENQWNNEGSSASTFNFFIENIVKYMIKKYFSDVDSSKILVEDNLLSGNDYGGIDSEIKFMGLPLTVVSSSNSYGLIFGDDLEYNHYNLKTALGRLLNLES